MLYFPGKSGGSAGKAKNSSKKPEATASESTGTGKWRIPKKALLCKIPSDEEEIGQARTLPCKNVAKFESIVPDVIRDKLDSRKLIPKEMSSLCSDFEKLMIHSVTKQSWAKHCSAWKLFAEFCDNFGVANKLPIKPELARAFVTWAITSRKLKSTTVKSYVSSLNIAHVLGNVNNVNLSSDPCVKMLLKGAGNSCDLYLAKKASRLPMNLPLLEILSHRIALLEWSEMSKQVFWTACTVSFYTSCRMGELLACSERDFDIATTLLWKHVKFLGEKELLIKYLTVKPRGLKER